MSERIAEHAPAKVNLALHVTGRRSDGYHLIDTLAAFTRAGDRITVEAGERDAIVITGPFGDGLPVGSDNLVVRARDLFRAQFPAQSRPVAIMLEKNLPIASGIGGGSSDAAATLRALCRLGGVGIDELPRDAVLSLGADVPMCLAARTVRAQGIGETLTRVAGVPKLPLVLVNPGVAVATPRVFAALAQRDNPPLPPLVASPDADVLLGWLRETRNDLQLPAIEGAPAISDALSALERVGARFVRMSGSGATCFGVFGSHGDAEAAAHAIAAAQPAWYVEATETIEDERPEDP